MLFAHDVSGMWILGVLGAVLWGLVWAAASAVFATAALLGAWSLVNIIGKWKGITPEPAPAYGLMIGISFAMVFFYFSGAFLGIFFFGGPSVSSRGVPAVVFHLVMLPITYLAGAVLLQSLTEITFRRASMVSILGIAMFTVFALIVYLLLADLLR